MAKKSDAKKLPQEPSATTGVMGVVDAEGNLLKDRVPTVEGARALLLACLQADFFSRRVRVIAQAELDGAEPYDQMALIQTGQQYRTNVNFRAMKLAHEKLWPLSGTVSIITPISVQYEQSMGIHP